MSDEGSVRNGQPLLFDLLDSPNKRLIAFPGRQGDTNPEAVDRSG